MPLSLTLFHLDKLHSATWVNPELTNKYLAQNAAFKHVAIIPVAVC